MSAGKRTGYASLPLHGGKGACPEGTLALSEPATAKPSATTQPIGPDLLRPLNARVRATQRDANGAVQTHTAFWDATTKGGVPAEVLRIYESALAGDLLIS